jgi:hypothetical protein
MPTITPQELTALLNVLARAQVTVAESTQIADSLQRLIALSRQPLNIGAVAPVVNVPFRGAEASNEG